MDLDLPDALAAIGFSARTPNKLEYVSPAGYTIEVSLNTADVAKSTIDYGPDIVVHRKTTSSFSQPETLVVLECVVRLLDIGYTPNRIELERSWKLGHKRKGYLDILLRDPGGDVFAMIECKNWGQDYAKERDQVLVDGGQIFSYFVQEKKTRSLYLYSSKVESTGITFTAEFVDAKTLTGSSNEELFDSWDQTFHPDGIFAQGAPLYDSSFRNLTKADLRDLDRESGRGLFNSFAEILRRHVLSDKSNAFNKIFNLFACKIADEGATNSSDETSFQWKVGDTYETLLNRLETLYAKALKEYLDIDIKAGYFSPYSEFNFVDIYDERTFERNGQVLKDAVQLLQGYRIRYSSKHQFLGDFFEMLLNTGIKQEAGQFFTPVPLARFIVRSLPIESIIERKIRARDGYVLPYVIDYACGSGHFLTEAIDEVDAIAKGIAPSSLVPAARARLAAGLIELQWAREYVYGVEEDYRLAKTTKIATFLHGDGDAIIMRANGLDDFHASEDFRHRLKASAPSRNHQVFDVLVANPPYSISNFATKLPKAAESFELAQYLTAQTAEIECFFVERAAQLLAEDGVAGLVLPLSVLSSNKAIYHATRQLILRRFRIVGLVELRDSAFSATTTTTVCVFLARRSDDAWYDTAQALRKHLMASSGAPSPSLQDALDKVEEVHPEVTRSAVDWLKSNDPGAATSYPESVDIVVACALAHDEEIVLAFGGQKKQEQEAFLGYRFSSARGREGIHLTRENDRYQSDLFDPEDYENDLKISTVIRRTYLNEEVEVSEELARSVVLTSLPELVAKAPITFHNPSYFFNDREPVTSNSPFGDFIDDLDSETTTVKELIAGGRLSYVRGLTYDKSAQEVPRETSNRILTASNIDLATGRLTFQQYRYLREGTQIDAGLKPKTNDIVMSIASGSLRHLGKVALALADVDGYVGGFLALLRVPDASADKESIAKALYYNLLSKRFREFVATLKDQNINNLTNHELESFEIRLPKDLDAFMEEVKRREDALNLLLQEQGRLRT